MARNLYYTMKPKKSTSWIISSQKSVYFFSAIIMAFLFLGCSARKVEQVKEIDKLKSAEHNSFTYFLQLKQLEINHSLDLGFSYTKETSVNGDLKETFVQNNKVVSNIKTIHLTRRIDSITYKTVTTYKSVNNKNTQKEAISIWVWVIGFLLASIVGLVVYYYPKIQR